MSISYSVSFQPTGFPYAHSEDLTLHYTEPEPHPEHWGYAPVGIIDYGEEHFAQHWHLAEYCGDGYAEALACMGHEPQCQYFTKREASSDEGDQDLFNDGVTPPQTLTLPFAVFGVGEEGHDSSEDGDKKKKKKKKKKKNKKVVEERPDPRLDANYWLKAPSAAECCIIPVDDEPVPYELLASM